MKIDYTLDHVKKTHSRQSTITFTCRHCDAVQDPLLVTYYYGTALVQGVKKRRWRYLDQYVADINRGTFEMIKNPPMVARLKSVLCNCDGKASALAGLKKAAQKRKDGG